MHKWYVLCSFLSSVLNVNHVPEYRFPLLFAVDIFRHFGPRILNLHVKNPFLNEILSFLNNFFQMWICKDFQIDYISYSFDHHVFWILEFRKNFFWNIMKQNSLNSIPNDMFILLRWTTVKSLLMWSLLARKRKMMPLTCYSSFWEF